MVDIQLFVPVNKKMDINSPDIWKNLNKNNYKFMLLISKSDVIIIENIVSVCN